MASIGSLVAAQSAKAIGRYNQALYNQQAAYADAKSQQQRTAYNQLDRPRLVNQQQRDYSQFFVSRMLTGAEFSGTAFDAALDFQVNQALDLSIADYNESIEYDEARNQSLLLKSSPFSNESILSSLSRSLSSSESSSDEMGSPSGLKLLIPSVDSYKIPSVFLFLANA